MARKLTLAEAQKVLDEHFPTSGITLKSYTGGINPGILEFPDGSVWQFSRFDILKRFTDPESLRDYLERHPLNNLPSNSLFSISVTGDQNTTLHNSPHASVVLNPTKTNLTNLLRAQNQLAEYLETVSDELPPPVNAALSFLISNLRQAQQDLQLKS